MLGGAGHFSLVDSEVEVDAGDVEVDEVGLANVAEKVFHVGLVVHEEVFGEDCGAAGVSKEVEGGLDVGIAVGEVHPEALVGDVDLGSVVEAGGEAVGWSVLGSGVGAPAGGVVPAVAFASSVAMDGDEDDVLFAEGVAEAVDAVAALEEADIVFFRYQKFGVLRAETMRPARSRFSAYSRRCPSGLRFPFVPTPWPLSIKIFIVGFVLRFLTVSYESSRANQRI